MMKTWVWMVTAILFLIAAGCGKASKEYADLNGNGQKDPYEDVSLPIPERVDDLISRMTLEEKVSQMGSTNPPVERLGIPAMQWHGEAKHAVVSCFPAAIGLAATWDTARVEEVASALADEARAKHNLFMDQGGDLFPLSFWAPTVNIGRDPRWGRSMEAYGEDPVLTGITGVAFARGMHGDHPVYYKALPGANHYAVNNEEWHRHSANAVVSERMMRNYYLPHFKRCVEEAGITTIGTAYNALNGVPACANAFLMQNLLRDEWGFNGHTFADWGAVFEMMKSHRYVSSIQKACELSIKAGTDLTGSSLRIFPRYLPDAVLEGMVLEAEIDTALSRIFTNACKLGIFDPPHLNPYRQIPESVIDSEEHRKLARVSAQESIVLLKNENKLLPLDKNNLNRILLTGPTCDIPVLGRKQKGRSETNVSALEGITRKLKGTGVEVVAEKEKAEAIRQAEKADVILFFTSFQEGEECDRFLLDIPPKQKDLLRAMMETGKKLVVVLYSGNSVSTMDWADRVPAILEAWYPGEEGGNALADILFGDANPSAKLPVTFYKSNDQLLDIREYDIRKGQTYLYMKEEPAYPFGHGLSYTSFAFSDLNISDAKAGEGRVLVSFKLTNTGSREGAEVAQLYLNDLVRSTGDQPIKALKGFRKVHLQPGEEKTISIPLRAKDLAFYDRHMNFIVEKGDFEVQLGNSSASIFLTDRFTIPHTITLEKGPDILCQDLTLDSKTLEAGESITLSLRVENRGEVSGFPAILINGKPAGLPKKYVSPSKTQTLKYELTLYKPGSHTITAGQLPPQTLRVLPVQARFRFSGLQASPYVAINQSFDIQAVVLNSGGQRGSAVANCFVDHQLTDQQSLSLSPGDKSRVTFNHTFARPGVYPVTVGNAPPVMVRACTEVNGNYHTFASREGSFRQIGDQHFVIHASGSLGCNPVHNNKGHWASFDDYGAVYLKKGLPEKAMVTAKLVSHGHTSNYALAGIMVRNDISAHQKSTGYIIMAKALKVRKRGLMEYDENEDGFIDKVDIYYSRDMNENWLRIRKEKTTFTGYFSHDGLTWEEAFEVEIPSANSWQDVGIFAASDNEQLLTAEFSDFEVRELP